MSRFFGAARQNGVIVEDLDRALDQWINKIGAGPFYVIRHLPLDYFSYLGQSSSPDLSIALGNVGDLQIELIQQHNDAPSPYLDFRTQRGPGLHHISAWTLDFDGAMATLQEQGLVPNCAGRITGSCRFAYWNADATDGSAYELSDLGSNNEFGMVHDLVREAAVGWDGSDPVRPLN